jgi:gluconolactonase
VYFTDQPNNRIMKWSVEGELFTFMQPAGRSNGLYVDSDGSLLACADEKNQLWDISMDKEVKVLVEEYQGKLLNGPNDLWLHPNGGIYFTDPLYKRPYWERDPEMQQEGQYVYYLEPDRETLRVVAKDVVKPNGIVGTPNGNTLYVADIGDKKTYKYDIADDGSLSNQTLFCEMGSDGMTIDAQGNLYLTGKGVHVFNNKGEKIKHIEIDSNWTANVCFGGPENKTLYITATKYLYALKMNVAGAR